MAKYLIMPEGGKWYEVEAQTAETAFRGVCCWYGNNKQIAIRNTETGETVIFSRSLDEVGNIKEVKRYA